MSIDFRDIPESDGCGIYAIINAYNLTVYIGCTRNLRKRALSHKTALERGDHANKKLQAAAKEGVMHFVVLEELPEDIGSGNMRISEMLYILDFSERPNYNLCNREAEDQKRLKENIIFDMMYYGNIDHNVSEAFHSTYGVKPWDMVRRKQHRRLV